HSRKSAGEPSACGAPTAGNVSSQARRRVRSRTFARTRATAEQRVTGSSILTARSAGRQVARVDPLADVDLQQPLQHPRRRRPPGCDPRIAQDLALQEREAQLEHPPPPDDHGVLTPVHRPLVREGDVPGVAFLPKQPAEPELVLEDGLLLVAAVADPGPER